MYCWLQCAVCATLVHSFKYRTHFCSLQKLCKKALNIGALK